MSKHLSMLPLFVSGSTFLPRCSSPTSSSDSNVYEHSKPSSGSTNEQPKCISTMALCIFYIPKWGLYLFVSVTGSRTSGPMFVGNFSIALIELVRLTSNVNSEAGILDWIKGRKQGKLLRAEATWPAASRSCFYYFHTIMDGSQTVTPIVPFLP